MQRKAADHSSMGPAAGYKAYKTENGDVYVVDEDACQSNKNANYKADQVKDKERRAIVPCFWIPNVRCF